MDMINYVAIGLDDKLFDELERNEHATATIFIPYSFKQNYTVKKMMRKFPNRVRVLEMNMGMENNRLFIANRFIKLYGGVLWTSSQLKPAVSQPRQGTSLKAGNAMELWEKFSAEE
jgi:hypothetical protein